MSILTRLFLVLGLMAMLQTTAAAVSLFSESASAFEERVLANVNKLKDMEEPQICQEVVKRLNEGYQTNEKVISRCMEAWIQYEESMAKSKKIEANRYAKSLQYIDAILAKLEEYPGYQSALLYRKAQLIDNSSMDRNQAAELLKQASQLAETQKLKLDTLRNRILVDLGNDYLYLKKPAEAEASFLQVLAYPWYTIEGHADEFQMLRSIYIMAGKGLIKARSGDQKKLKEIIFVPATMEELGPELEKEISRSH